MRRPITLLVCNAHAQDTELRCELHEKYLHVFGAIPFTSVEPERGFSWEGRFCNNQSNRLSEGTRDDAQMVAMNAPEPVVQEEDYVQECTEHFCTGQGKHR